MRESLTTKLVYRRVLLRVISFSFPTRDIDSNAWSPQALSVCPTVGKCPGDANSTDGIKLVGVEEHLCLERLRCRSCAESMGQDRVHNSRQAFFRDAEVCQIAARTCCSYFSMVQPTRLR